jgi:hypothetical protein
MRAMTALFLALAATSAFGAEVYTWRDAGGNTHFSDTPPPGVAAKKMRGGTSEDAQPPAQAAPRRSLADQEMEFRKRKADAEAAQAKADKEKSEAEESKRNCEQSRNQLQALESGQRMSRINAEGETIFMEDDARVQEIERARKAVQSWCK